MNLSFYIETLRLALTNLRLHKLRSALTSMGIIIGVGAVIIMLAIGEGAKRETIKQVEQLGATNIIIRSVQPPESNLSSNRSTRERNDGLKMLDLATLVTQSKGPLAAIDTIVPLRDSGMDVLRGSTKASNVAAVGTTPDFLSVANLHLAQGRFLTTQDMDAANAVGNPVCVIGAGVESQLFNGQPALGQTILVGNESQPSPLKIFQVVGVLQTVGLAAGAGSAMTGRDLNNDVYFPLSANSGLFGFTISKQNAGSRERRVLELSEIYVRVKNADSVVPMAAAIEQLMSTRHATQQDVVIKVPRELLNQAEWTQMIFSIVMGCIAGLALIVGGIGIMNISLASVTERTREIGVRRALGARQVHIILQFLIETATLSFTGGFIGIGGGFLCAMILGFILRDVFPTYVTLWSVLLSFLISVSVGILAGLYPAIVAAKKDPIEALRHD